MEPQAALSTAPAQTNPGPPLPLTRPLTLTDRPENADPVAADHEMKGNRPLLSDEAARYLSGYRESQAK